jgi:hypothetical protein
MNKPMPPPGLDSIAIYLLAVLALLVCGSLCIVFR